MLLAEHGISGGLVHSGVASGRSLQRPGWQELMIRVQVGDTIVVAFLDRLSRNFEDGVRIQAELTRRKIGIVAIRKNIDTREESAAARFFRRSMLAQRAYQVDSASERIRLGRDRARASGKRMGRPPALSPEQTGQCRRMAGDGAGLRHIVRVLGCSPATVKNVLEPGGDHGSGAHLPARKGRNGGAAPYTHLGASKAITATAHKLARLIYAMLRYGREYVDAGAEYYEREYQQCALRTAKRRAAQLGYQLVPMSDALELTTHAPPGAPIAA